MAVSKLATYKHLTDKCNPRTAKITKITIHHMSGIMTGKDCCDYFCKTDRQVSANYCIGYGGDIACNVDESKRAWTSSSRANDMQAVTIEVSNDITKEPWSVSDKAMTALIGLCADICRRNGIKELKFTGTSSGTLTYHYMFASTDCPGTYIKSKTQYICEQVNKALKALQDGKSDNEKGSETAVKPKEQIKEVKATVPARKYNKNLAGLYRVTAPAGLYLRNGPGTEHKAFVLLPQKTEVRNYGYYDDNGGRWLYVATRVGNTDYTGFCYALWLKKV